jgi:hypothetical protein
MEERERKEYCKPKNQKNETSRVGNVVKQQPLYLLANIVSSTSDHSYKLHILEPKILFYTVSTWFLPTIIKR